MNQILDLCQSHPMFRWGFRKGFVAGITVAAVAFGLAIVVGVAVIGPEILRRFP